MSSCFGCGDDWSGRWEEFELARMRIDDEIYDVCPDCVEEVLQQYERADFAGCEED